jgi:hypothetical protein
MPYKLRKAPKRDLYWVVGEDGSKKSKDPIPRKRAEAQMRALYASENQMKGGMCYGRCYQMTAKQKSDAEDEGVRHLLKIWAEGELRTDYMVADTIAELGMRYPYTTEEQLEEITQTALKLFREHVDLILGRYEQRMRANAAVRAANEEARRRRQIIEEGEAEIERQFAAQRAEQQRLAILNQNSLTRQYERDAMKEVDRGTKRGYELMPKPDTSRRR